MKRIINIDKTFLALRQLPLAVSYEQVEAWVKATGNNTELPDPLKTKVSASWWRSALGRFSNN